MLRGTAIPAPVQSPARRGVAPPSRVLVAEDGVRERAEATEPRLSVLLALEVSPAVLQLAFLRTPLALLAMTSASIDFFAIVRLLARAGATLLPQLALVRPIVRHARGLACVGAGTQISALVGNQREPMRPELAETAISCCIPIWARFASGGQSSIRRLTAPGEKSPAVMSSKARVRLASKWPTLEIRLEERRQDRHGFIDVLRHIVVRRRKDVANSVATSLRLFQRLSASRIPGGRSWGPPRGLLRSCAVV